MGFGKSDPIGGNDLRQPSFATTITVERPQIEAGIFIMAKRQPIIVK